MTSRLRAALLLGLLVPPALRVEPAQAQVLGQVQGSGQPIFSYGQGPGAYRYRAFPYRYAPYVAPYGPSRLEEEVRPVPRSAYRTLCVRLCDGYYFPISSAATQDTLAHDAEMCSASCGSEARLFFHPGGGGDVGSAVDLTGIAYSSLPNAFKYRKTLVEDCRCRPQPWSEAELERHRGYAQGQSLPPPEGQSRQPGLGNIEVIAGDYAHRRIVPGLPGVDDDRAVPRPDPVVRNIEPILPERPLFGAGGWELPRGPYAWPYGRRY